MSNNERRFSDYYDPITEPILVVRTDSRIIEYANAEAAELFGYSKSALCGKNTLMLYHNRGGYQKAGKNIADAVKSRKKQKRQDVWFKKSSGRKFLGDMSISFLYEKSGKTFCVAIIRDLTEQKRHDERLKNSEYKFSTIFNVSPLMMAISELTTGRFLETNRAFASGTGFSKEDVLGKTSVQLGLMSQTQRDELLLKISNGGGSMYSVESVLCKKSGELMNVLLFGERIKFQNEDCLLSIVMDITERKRMEKMIVQSEELYRRAVEEQMDFMLKIKPDGEILFANRSFREFASKTGRLKSNIFDYIVEDDKKYFVNALRLITPQNPYVMIEPRVDFSYGTTGWIQWSVRGLFGPGSVLSEVNITGRDVTDKRLSQEALEYRYRLEKLIFSIANDFINIKINDLNVKLDKSLRGISEFIGCEHACLFIVEDNHKTARCISEYLDSKYPDEKIGGGMYEKSEYPWFSEKMLKLESVYWENVDMLPQEADVEKKIFKSKGIKSFALFPVYYEKRLQGFVCFCSYGRYIQWTEDIKGLMRIYSLVVENVLERKRVEDILRDSVVQKDTLLKEIHHRIKNNLQMISSIFHLASSNIADKEALSIFKSSQDRIKSIAFVHQKLYQTEDLSKINFRDYILELTKDLSQTYSPGRDNAEIRINMDEIQLDIDTSIPCGLIISEFVANSLKYACPPGTGKQPGDKCIISINMQNIKNKYILDLSDNGPGLPDNVDFNSKKSLGMRLISNLVKQINGQLRYEYRNGTCFFIIFHLNKRNTSK